MSDDWVEPPPKMRIRVEKAGKLNDLKPVFVLRTDKGRMLAFWREIGPLVDEARLVAARGIDAAQ